MASPEGAVLFTNLSVAKL